MQPCKVIDYRGYTIEIYPDDSPCNPRKDDNFGHMICWHRRYDLGDKHDFKYPEDFCSIMHNDNALILPLYLYDHSGITMSTGGFSCPWDSGQVGYIYVTKKEVREQFKRQIISKKLREKVFDILRQEVKTYDDYLTGNVHGFIIKDDKDNELDSCWGYYGDDSYNMITECKHIIDGYIEMIHENALEDDKSHPPLLVGLY